MPNSTSTSTRAQRPPPGRPPSLGPPETGKDGSHLHAAALLSAASSQVGGPARSVSRAGDAALRTAQRRNRACEFGPRSVAFSLVGWFLNKRSALVMDI